MATTKEIQQRKEADIKAKVKSMLALNKYKLDYILEQVAYEFYIKPITAARIYWGEYDTGRQRKKERADLVAYNAQHGLPSPPRRNAKQPPPTSPT